MAAIVRACAAERWPARIAAVVANRPDAPGLALAREAGVTARGLDDRRFASRAEFDAALAAEIDRHAPDLVVLAGFMRVLTPEFVAQYAGRMLNVHPSLLPSFPGLHPHRRALEAGVKWHGATVHLVSAEVDGGPIVAQAAVPVMPGDDAEALAARVLQAEHLLYPRAVRWFVEDRVAWRGGRLHADDDLAPQQACVHSPFPAALESR